MTISIQPLDSHGNPTDKDYTEDWGAFLRANDGFLDSPLMLADMLAALNMGSGYILGGGAAGAFRLKRVEEAAALGQTP